MTANPTKALSTSVAIVRIRLKDGVLDPQGVTIHKALRTLGFDKALGVRSGKYYEIELAEDSPETRDQVRKMCENALVNQVIENYTIEWLGGVPAKT